VIPHRRLQRVPFDLPELRGYAVDSEGQVWRIGGTRTGRDRPLRGMEFTDAVRAWETRGNLGKPRVLRRMPGVWKWCPEDTPGAGEDRLHRQSDATGFAHYYLRDLGPEFMDARREAFASGHRGWFVILPPEDPRGVLLVAGRVAFVGICANPSAEGLRPE
jgi:hypothetical protein